MSIFESRQTYRPFEYPAFYDFYRNQQLVHWTKDEINLGQDIQDWNSQLTENEKNIIGGILKGFTQMEILVGDYWRNVAEWFPKPEIAMMSSAYSYFESIHMDNYAMINEQLQLDDFSAFLYDPATKQKLDYFIERPGIESKEDIAKSLAIFSAFAEGCLLFSSFAVLLSFQRENLMKGIGQIVSFSIRDENSHSEGGIYLFNKVVEEYPEIKSRVEADIYEAAKTSYELEEQFLSNLFTNGDIRTLTKNELLNFVKNRINMKLISLGYKELYEIDGTLLRNMSWFGSLSSGREFGDFFATRVTEYTQNKIKTDDLF
jgi:ribonucleoside-diphosphate reductase beta chain